jgi:hypothetical protein
MATNRFTQNNKDIQTYDESKALLEIMRSEFPKDEYYKNGYLTPEQLTATIQPITAASDSNVKIAERNDNNVVTVYRDVTEYVEYPIDKSVPTIDETELDDLLDDEWEYFTQPGQLRQPTTTGLFLIPKEIQLNPTDFHHEYIVRGPENINSLSTDDDVASNIFCVYYIDNDIAFPIPNYKTLEVMLVERGLTYSVIREASTDDSRNFDMIFDGKFVGDLTPNSQQSALEEFSFRKLPDRTLEWNERVRFESGYRPKAPFKRDPGDYLKPIGYRGTGASDVYIDEDPGDRYFDLAFQGQTYKEKLREKYEGKMVIDRWPVPYNNDTVIGNQSIVTDDLVLGARLMINGYWKGVEFGSNGGGRVLETYAQLNGYSFKDFQPGQGKYGERGYLNLLVQQGGLTVLHVQEDERPSAVWDDFAHIAEINRLDPLEYEDYINNQSNNGQIFDIEYLNPYEPKGSLRYYKQSQIDRLQMEAAEQAAFDNIKEQILEYWPRLATKTEEFRSRINNIQNTEFETYYNNKFFNNCPIYKIITADEAWKFLKKKKKDLKVLDEETNLLALFEKNVRISTNFNADEEDRIVYQGKWGRVLDENLSEDTINLYFTEIGISGTLDDYRTMKDNKVDNDELHQLPRGAEDGGRRIRKLVKNTNYIKLMINNELNYRIKAQDVWERVKYADSVIGELRSTVDEATDLLLTIDQRLLNATEASELSDIYTSIMEFYAFLNSINNDDLQYCIDTKAVIDNILRTFISDIYNSVEYFRQRVNDAIGKKGKFGVQWPESAKAIVNSYVSGKTFDNYLPTEED